METNRTQLLLGEEALLKLENAKILIIGLGGVGGICAEALVRTGIKNLTIIDKDFIEKSNVNRQIIALSSTLNKNKTEVLKHRLLDINPKANVNAVNMFYLKETAGNVNFSEFDYIIDAIDTVSAKIEIVVNAKANNVPVISCMGTGGKSEISCLKIADIYSTSVCPLAKVMRRELKKRGIDSLKVVYSSEEYSKENVKFSKKTPCSTMFVPSAAGLMLASEVVKDLLK